MTNPHEILEEKLDKGTLEYFDLWLERFDGVKEETDKEVVGLFRGATGLTKKKAVERAKEVGHDEIAYKIEALMAVDYMNQGVFARTSLANEIEKGQTEKERKKERMA